MNEDLFGSIKQTITETAGAVGKKTEEFVETQKMRNKVRTLQREIRKKYADVGEIVYKRYVDGDTMDEELVGHCEVVMGLQKELAECKESMAAKQGKNVCPACGISNPKDAVFCMYCGTELPGEEEEKEEEWFTQGPVEKTEDQEEKEEKAELLPILLSPQARNASCVAPRLGEVNGMTAPSEVNGGRVNGLCRQET